MHVFFFFVTNMHIKKIHNHIIFLFYLGIVPSLSQSVTLSSFAHINDPDVQELIDKQKNIKIQFDYSPDKPIIDTFTQLQFSIQNLTNDQHIKDFDARVVVTGDQRLFKFENIIAHDGDFSVKYIFPDDGTHQVLLRVNTNNSIILASFSVFVPHQSPPSLLNPFPQIRDEQNDIGRWISIVLIIVIPILVLISIIAIVKKKI